MDIEITTEIDDPGYLALVRSEMSGHEGAREILLTDLGRWQRCLQHLTTDVQAQFAQRKAQDAAFRNECMARGPAGKKEWFHRAAETDKWRGSANAFLRHVNDRLREVKELQKAENIAGSQTPSKGSIMPILDDIVARLDRIERLLIEED